MNSEELILSLAAKAAPVRHLAYRRVCAVWLLLTLTSLSIITAAYGMRADMPLRAQEWLFLWELGLNAVLIVVSGCTAIATAYPDRARTPLLRALVLLAFSAYSALTFMSVSTPTAPDMPPEQAIAHGMECMLCILSFAALPACWLYLNIRRLATVDPAYTAATAILTALATGCLGVRLVENELLANGLILWHYLPLVVLSAAGYLLGKKIFRW